MNLFVSRCDVCGAQWLHDEELVKLTRHWLLVHPEWAHELVEKIGLRHVREACAQIAREA